ncbi:hypothetical protein HME7025_00079 [Aquirufa nivalisilvae]|uniref:Uncharacterized protein n=1 Tax=Aquirufa nivalisilvae TaxID=2516557 RepID=A0A2S2DRE6_9BACT|nr:hypothetical protein [Aquirufa nivalisilvae]AWL07964.1 hypothetical protein HME7025_00079 [Aquirufa nivalisilvae]
MILTIQVKPFVKHLITKQYGSGKKPIDVRLNSDLGYLFWLGFGSRSIAEDVLHGLKGEGVLELEKEEHLVELQFYLGGRFDREVLTDSSIKKMTNMLESYCRIFMKGFATGYKCLLNSTTNSAVVFHRIYDFTEEVLTEDNAIKIIQRECAEIHTPFIDKKSKRSQVSYK